MVRRDKSNYIIQSVSHALDVLEEFHGDVDELGVTELSKKLKLHKNNVFRILATLQSRNYIEQNKANENYRLGIRCLELGQTFIHQRGMLKQANPVLQELAEKTGETSYVSIMRGNEVVYLDSVEPETTVRVVSRLGLHMPTHATAAGKVLVAFESEEDLRKRFSGELKSYTKNTFRTVEELFRDLEAVREKGYATDLEEFEEGLRCVASPIRDYTRKVIGALSVSGPAHRLADEKIQTIFGAEVVRLGKELSIRLGFRE
ncbi:MAG: IclR family transcriptional regulator [Deltaproteobacteria bacterium CSP1-8]|jgi:DNA-binding IclR family transcriptional regulator|nr:MAG: IclR family transcriptional regulator [Deltaproteobacteria bacterium CSP1-8]